MPFLASGIDLTYSETTRSGPPVFTDVFVNPSAYSPRYNGVDIFTFDGLDRFLNDSRRVVQFLITDIRRKRGKKLSTLTPPPSPVS